MQFRPKKIDYTSPASAQGGPGVQKQITHYYGTPYLNMTPAVWAGVAASIGASIGDTWWLGGGARANGGNAFMFVKSKSALALGQVVAARSPTVTVDDAGGAAATAITGAGSAVSPTTTTAVLTTNIQNSAFAVPVGVNEDVDNWIYVDSVAGAAAGIPQIRRIKANSSSTTSFYTVAQRDPLRPNSPTDQDVFDYVPLNAEPVSIVRPYHVQLCTDILPPVGIALGTVTAGNYTIIQVAGLATVLATNTGAATVVNVPAIVQAGSTITGAAGTANLYLGAGSILPQLAYNAAPALLIPCFVNFLGQ